MDTGGDSGGADDDDAWAKLKHRYSIKKIRQNRTTGNIYIITYIRVCVCKSTRIAKICRLRLDLSPQRSSTADSDGIFTLGPLGVL